ncbi:MAG: BlaI/MecI/CopY family transcriptional regulator [Planctomycetota bacterium]
MKLNDSEWTIMQAVWSSDAPVTARDVHADVEEETAWSYSTVRTLLTRLAEKGALSEAKSGKHLVYEAALERRAARHSAVRSLVDKAFGGTFGSLVQHLANEERLSARDREELARLIEKADGGGRPTKRRRRGTT